MTTMLQRALAGAGAALLLVGASAEAQQPKTKTTRIRAQIEKVDGNTLMLKARNGAKLTIKMADKYRVAAMVKGSLADLKPNAYIGVTAMPEADGSQRAIAIHIFQPKQRGTGEGHRPWDLRPGSTMTNAAIETTVAGTDGQIITVRYKQGNKVDTKKVIVTPKTVIVRYVPGDRKEVKAGVHVIIHRAAKQADGTFTAAALNYGRGGIVPPM